MNQVSISQLQKMDKDELMKQAFSLLLENETLRHRITHLEGENEGSSPPFSEYDEEQRRLLDKLGSLVFTCNAKGEITYVNQAGIELSGFSRAELLHRNMLDLVDEDSMEDAMTRIMAQFTQSPVQVSEFQIKKKDGSLVWLEIFGVTLEDYDGSEDPFLLVNAVDISKRVAAELELRKSEALFRGFAENLLAAIYLLNEKGEIIYANPFASQMSGYSNRELLNLPGYNIIHPDDREMAIARNQARLRGEDVPDKFDLRLRVKGGEIKWAELHMETFEIDGRTVTLGTAIDITSRKTSEKALRLSEERFKAFAENLQVLLYTYDRNGYFTYVNPMCEKLVGYSQEELLQMNFTELLHEDYRGVSIERAALRRSAALQDGKSFDVACVTKDGRNIWLELSGVRLNDDEDDLVILGNAVDITARVESEEALKESELKFRNLFERSTDPMLLLDENGFFDCNTAAVKVMKAASKQEIMVHPSVISAEFQPDGSSSLEKAQLKIKEAYHVGACHFEWQHQDFNGQLFWSDVSFTVIPFKQRKILFTVWRDISEFKTLEQLLRDEREQLLVTLRSIGDAVITTDIEGRVVLMNRVAEHLTGWSQEEAAGRMMDEILELVSGKNGESVVNPLARAVSGGMVLDLPEETLLISRSGHRFKIADSASPIRDKNSQIIGGVMVFRDISDRERLQEEVLKFKKLESVGRLAGGIAHDFNNLLTGIMGNLEIAGMRLTANPDQARENIDKSLKAAQRAADLTQKLLTFAKGGEPVKKTADLGEIIRDSAEFVMSGSNIALDFEVADDLCAAEVDTGQISQVIQNLVINAIQAMPDGGTITVRVENFKFESREQFSIPLPFGTYIKISVRDHGLGITSGIIQKVFDPFFTTRTEGSGLGLSVVHSIVSKHGGHVAVYSEPGEITEFIVFLPALNDCFAKPGLIPPIQSQTPLQCGHILIMDDDELICEILSGFLEDQGHIVVTVHHGEDVLKEYKRQKFSLVILDLTIPGGMGGRETIKLLREYDPSVKAIVSSGYANDPMMSEYSKYGFYGCLNKPYILEDLLQLVNRILAGG